MSDNLIEVAQELLKACKAQHDAIDRLFAELIQRDDTFFPSKSGKPWEALEEANRAIARAEELLKEFNESYYIKVSAFESGVLMGVIIQAEDHIRNSLSGVYKQLVDMKKEIEQAEGVTKEVLPGGMLKISDADGNVIIREPYPWEIEGN